MGSPHVPRDSQHVVRSRDGVFVGVQQTLLDEVDGDIGDVDTYPPPLETHSRVDGGTTTAEWIKNDVALIATGRNNAFHQLEWLLGFISEFLGGPVVDRLNVRPNILDHLTRHLIKVLLDLGVAGGRVNQAIFSL